MPDREAATVLPLNPAPLVLIVDDELAPRSVVRRAVQALGYPARSCRSGREALQFLAAHPREVRLLIADLGMPKMDGGELIERALALDPSMRVLLMASPADPHAAELLPGYHDLPLLVKPFGFSALQAAVEELLGPPPESPMTAPPSMRPRRRIRQRTSGHHEV